MFKRNFVIATLILLASLATILLNAPLVSSQGLTITAAAVEGALPLEAPDSELWRLATAVEVPLSAQMIARPILPETNAKAITVRALHNGEEIAFLLEWADATRNDATVRVEDFRDAVALQFPLIDGQPFYCMGQQGGDVNIWHWKADWQAALIARRTLQDVYPNIHVDMYPFVDETENLYLAAYADVDFLPAEAVGNLLALPVHTTPVEDMVAGGFGSLTSQPPEGQNVQGYGEWRDGLWRVILSRSLRSAEAEDVSFAPEKLYSVAFAAWDGANRERNGAKSTSQWVSLQLGAAPAPAAAPAAGAAAPSPARTAAVTPSGIGPLFWGFIGLLVVLWALIALTLLYFRDEGKS
ncbi:ethylbenzene dehydrogenase-related protein [Caldilinea sp.]|uniref:ethylbenzene dehydrogenase-related protein n=1 Tax=Caldilinea sp. TaxID=2293560 RepID=UPI0021DD86AC|nr:ethylbenzene dehydrogenase-related protein [Caldilinea sp.]GIV68349.1 MAG: hypothetical protein KatS3mg048_1211 [Caldilinea sp.]